LTTVAIISLLMISVVILNVKATDATSTWPAFHFGVTTSNGPSTNQVAWTFKAENGFWSSRAVADGIVYAGSYDHNVYAFVE
jgi:outer membrane protein assembly factor BamB